MEISGPENSKLVYGIKSVRYLVPNFFTWSQKLDEGSN